MRRIFTLVSVLLLTLALAGCRNPVTKNSSEGLTSEGTTTDAVTPYAPSDANIQQDKSGERWQEAFAELLLDYSGRIIGEYAEYMWETENFDFPFSGLFTLRDMDGNGIPELIVWQADQGGFFSIYSAYTFSNNQIVPIEIIGSFGGRGSSIFSPPNNMPGIITTIVESGFTRYTLIKMEGYSLSAPISIYEDWTGKQSSDGLSLYFVRGLEVTPMESPYELSHIFDCCCVEERVSRGIVYTLVAQEEFYRVLEDVFGNPGDFGECPSEISEFNIQSMVLGG